MHRDFNPYRLLRILHVKSLLWIRRQLLPSQQPSFTNLIFSPSSMLVLIRKSRRGCQGCSLKKLKGFCRLHPTRYPILRRARIAWNWAFHAQNVITFLWMEVITKKVTTQFGITGGTGTISWLGTSVIFLGQIIRRIFFIWRWWLAHNLSAETLHLRSNWCPVQFWLRGQSCHGLKKKNA